MAVRVSTGGIEGFVGTGVEVPATLEGTGGGGTVVLLLAGGGGKDIDGFPVVTGAVTGVAAATVVAATGVAVLEGGVSA